MASTAALRADLPAVPTGPWRLRRGRMIVGDGSGGRDVDGGAPGADRAGPEGAGGGVRGGGGRGGAGAGGERALRELVAACAVEGVAAGWARPDPPRSGRATPVRRVVGAVAW